MKRLSIGLRLTLWYLVIFAAAQLVFGVGMWLILRQNLYDIVDDALEAQIDDVQRFLAAQKPGISSAKLKEEVAEAYVLEHSGDYLQIYDAGGERIYQASFLQKNPLAAVMADQLRKPLYEDRELGGRPFRFLSERIEADGHSYAVQMGLPADDVLLTLMAFRRYLLMFAPLILVVASAVGYWLSRRALSPVDTLARTARNITGTNLSHRLEQLHTGDELQHLSDTLNEMLDRIEAAFLRVAQFTADASHELRTPISLIRTEAEVALRRTRTEAEYQGILRHILLEAERTSSLIEKLLALARADSGREMLDIQDVDLRRAVLDAANDWRSVAAARNLQFTETVADRELRVLGDKTALHHLLNILLDNAVKYTPAPGSINLCLEEKGDRAVLRVRDTGIGIAPEDHARIFERFYRADKARSRELGGAGLGLAIAQWIVQQHHGLIAVESSLGKGCVFTVELPIQSDVPTAPVAKTFSAV